MDDYFIENDGIYISELDMYCYLSLEEYQLLQKLNLVEAWYNDTWSDEVKYKYYTLLGYQKEEIDELF